MKRLLMALMLVLMGTFQWGCGSKAAAPTTPGSSSPTYTYPFKKFIGDYGVSGSGNGQFDGLFQIAIYHDTLFALDKNNSRLEKFDLNGNFLSSGPLSGSSSPWGLVIYNGVLFVGDFSNNSIHEYDINLNSLGTLVPTIPPDEPTDFAVDSTGRIYFGNVGNSTVERCNNDGSACVTVGGPGSSVGLFNGTYGIAVDGSGNIYAGDQDNNRVQKFNSSLASPTVLIQNGTASGSVFAPCAVGVDNNGNIWVSDSPVITTSRVQKFTPSGAYITTVNAPTSYPFSDYNILSFAFDPGGSVYMSDYINDAIFKYAPY